jgi:hypothetical protein
LGINRESPFGLNDGNAITDCLWGVHLAI